MIIYKKQQKQSKSVRCIMLKNEREREIISLLQEKGFVSTKELCSVLFASESSVRRSLAALEKQGIVKRIYGGGELIVNRSEPIAFVARAHRNVAEKRIIAQKAEKLIKDGAVVFLDQSSSAYYLAQEIANNGSLTVVTNNVDILHLLSNSRAKVISSGGMLCEGNGACLVGGAAERTFREIYADILFFSAKSLSEDGVITDCSFEEVSTRNAMLQNAATRVFLCDSEKVGNRCAYKQCLLSDVDYLVCDKDVSDKFANACKLL